MYAQHISLIVFLTFSYSLYRGVAHIVFKTYSAVQWSSLQKKKSLYHVLVVLWVTVDSSENSLLQTFSAGAEHVSVPENQSSYVLWHSQSSQAGDNQVKSKISIQILREFQDGHDLIPG